MSEIGDCKIIHKVQIFHLNINYILYLANTGKLQSAVLVSDSCFCRHKVESEAPVRQTETTAAIAFPPRTSHCCCQLMPVEYFSGSSTTYKPSARRNSRLRWSQRSKSQSQSSEPLKNNNIIIIKCRT